MAKLMDNHQTQSLSPKVLALAKRLHRALRPEWEQMTFAADIEVLVNLGAWTRTWRVAPIPLELEHRQVELVVSANDSGGLAKGLESGTDALVVDFDDTFSPTWANVLQGYANLQKLGNSALEPILLMRPRPLYLSEAHLLIEGQPAIAGLLDLCVYLFYLYKRWAKHHRGLYVYLPKIETLAQAQLWERAMVQAEEALDLPYGSVRVGLQIETLPAALQAEALLYALRHRTFGLNAGRWDYVFSILKKIGHDPKHLLPDREGLGMDQAFLQAYEQVIVQTCYDHGAQAIGGTAALMPDAENPAPVLRQVALDKAREARQGFGAAWAGLPSLVETVRGAFPGKFHPGLMARNPAAHLMDAPKAKKLKAEAVRNTLGIALEYLTAWLEGQGWILRQGRIEDTATAELARAQLWQWLKHRVLLDDGSRFTQERYLEWRSEALTGLKSPKAQTAAEILDELVLAPECPDYFPRLAYPRLTALGDG